ncbi:hypothetical protein [Flavobacterium sp. ov086]|uniref:hypothetical protein n=1 Tax=Flavobacterium sp. ov086 TaxID=1761785 RepID=UPI000B73DC62|nr:hypothetical protein [Flavobacterium sp. ov086]SNR55703.1 hypothetical protein SAMN04487979_11153 [Flavobacterium sp. ov086]
MKKYAYLLLFALLLNGCDDGDLTVDSIDFDKVTATNCDTTNTLLYKIKDRESILLQLAPSSLINNPTPEGQPVKYDIKNDSQYRVVYRAYDGTVGVPNICGIIPPKTPNVIEEWLGTSGKIEITTTQITTVPSEVDGSTRITGYNHNIIFRNISFLKPTQMTQVEAEYIFGDFKITQDPPTLTFAKPDEAGECPDLKQVYNYNAAFYIMLEHFDPTLFVNVATPPGVPRVRNITATENNVVYRTLTGVALNKDYFCNAIAPTNPAVKETWNGTSGTVEVTTEIAGTIVQHTIVIKNVTLVKGNSSFKLGNNFAMGTVTK